MKKSNKIFFVFLFVLPLMMIVHNLLLKAQYAKGNLTGRQQQRPHLVDRPLKPFRHLVLNGKAVLNFPENPYGGTEMKSFQLEVGPEHQPHVSLHSNVGNFVKERYSGDTLFISYEADRIRSREDLASYDSREIIFYAPSLASLTIRKAKMQTISIRQQTPLNVMVENSLQTVFSQVEVPVMSISAGLSTITFSPLMKVDYLWYESFKPSTYYFNEPHEIGKIVKGAKDSLSRISISGSAAIMMPYLNKQ